MASAFIMRNIDWIDGSKLTLPGGGGPEKDYGTKILAYQTSHSKLF